MGKTTFVAPPLGGTHRVYSVRSSYDELDFINQVSLQSTDDAIDHLILSGALDAYNEFTGLRSEIRVLDAMYSSRVSLTECDVGTLNYGLGFPPQLEILGTLVRGDVSIAYGLGTSSGLAPSGLSSVNGFSIEYNTFLGAFSLNCYAGDPLVENIRSNVIIGPVDIACESDMVLTNNLFFFNESNISIPNGTEYNDYGDPQFCDAASGDYTVADTSPCVNGGHLRWTHIGAFGIGCGITTVLPTTWGQIKARYGDLTP